MKIHVFMNFALLHFLFEQRQTRKQKQNKQKKHQQQQYVSTVRQ